MQDAGERIMDRKIDVTAPEVIRERLYPDLNKYMRMGEAERETFDTRWKTYVERALYVLLTNGQLDRSWVDGLSIGDVAWLNRMAQHVVSRHHQFDNPLPFGACLSEKQFETVIRNREGGERISCYAETLSGIARTRVVEYNEQVRAREPRNQPTVSELLAEAKRLKGPTQRLVKFLKTLDSLEIPDAAAASPQQWNDWTWLNVRSNVALVGLLLGNRENGRTIIDFIIDELERSKRPSAPAGHAPDGGPARGPSEKIEGKESTD